MLIQKKKGGGGYFFEVSNVSNVLASKVSKAAKIPGGEGGAVIFEMDTGVRPAHRQAGAFGESTGSKNEGSLGESMIFGIR